MTTTLEDITEAVLPIYKQNLPHLRTEFDNHFLSDADPDDTGVWVRLNILPGEKIQQTIGGLANCYRTFGVLIAQVFSPAAKGTKGSTEAVDQITSVFHGVDWNGFKIPEGPSFTVVGKTGNDWQINLTFQFRYEKNEAIDGQPLITSIHPPDCFVNTPYTHPLAMSGDRPVLWTVSSGTLPPGLTVDSDRGLLTGTPTASGLFEFTLKANNPKGRASQSVSMVSVSDFTPADLPLLAWVAPRLVDDITFNRQGPSWASQPSQTHARGLNFNAVDNYIDAGVPLYDDTAPGMMVTMLWFQDDSKITSNDVMYSEGSSSSITPQLQFKSRSGDFRMRFNIEDDASLATVGNTNLGGHTNETWGIHTIRVGAAGWTHIINGIDRADTAFSNAPATTTLDRATIGALGNTGESVFWGGPVAYAIRHDSVKTLAEIRQIQQYIADVVFADVGTITITGSETADSNSPFDEWAMDEDADGAELANSGSASTVGQRLPGDTISAGASGGAASTTQTTEADQPKYISNVLNGLAVIRYPGPTDPVFLDLPDLSSEATLECWIVRKKVAGANAPGMYDFGTSASANHWEHGSGIFDDFGRTDRILKVASPVPDLTEWRVIGNTAQAADWKTWIDGGSPVWTSTTGTYGVTSAAVLGRGKNTSISNTENGDQADVIVTNVLTTEQRAQLREYLNRIYDLSASAPLDS